MPWLVKRLRGKRLKPTMRNYNGRKLKEEKYEQHKVSPMMKHLYEWIVEDKMDEAKEPEFVEMG